ncbi:hypothetical protein ABB37_05009 [Leptomonas pyrrhocoris]|uniref:Uncharacterized protein n=1 Tax=Leptomonas pyrrhocoris TaxID=157538 RepID=A0A0N0DV75_LEPPY|nr:hypothetical protein ABB37_05009 [Leptomonas pyrrhocoris]KPA79962.1 hypothetical protein ABB37_05009 [Leptomonas pyrrhocoris]|eukprot:XP_015658401.1 hypothetical protein ABB37_05009 [Leptomonas pyrrhocoris]
MVSRQEEKNPRRNAQLASAMKFTLQAVLFFAFPALVTAMVASLLVLGSAELWNPERDINVFARNCGPAGPCVRITSGPIDRLVVDHVDFERDTVGDVIKRIPAWFGSQARPLGLTAHNLLLREDMPLRNQSLSALSLITLVSMKEMRM